MVNDFKYILKRILIGVGIALALMFLRGNIFILANALEANVPLSNSYVYSNGYGSQSGLPPLRQSYGNRMTLFFSNTDNSYILTSGTFDITFYVDIYAKALSVSNVVLYVYNGAGSVIRANPDRNEVLLVQELSTNHYQVYYNFELDVTSNFNKIELSFDYNCEYTSSFTQSGIDGATLLIDDFSSYSSDTQGIISNNNQNTTTIINNNNVNSQDIINNQNNNTQSIINNQNNNTDKEIESQKVCSSIDYNKSTLPILYVNKNIGSTGVICDDNSMNLSDYIKVHKGDTINIKQVGNLYNAPSICLYNTSKTLLSCVQYARNENINISVSENGYILYSSTKLLNSNTLFSLNSCINGNQAIVDSQQNINNTINDDNVNTQQASDFFSNFQSDNHGLSGIITSPLRLIQSLSSSQCSPLVLPLPFVNQSATIPCMSSVYSKFPTFYSLWQLISTGLIAYYILINLFSKVHSLQNPQDDRIEVLNL